MVSAVISSSLQNTNNQNNYIDATQEGQLNTAFAELQRKNTAALEPLLAAQSIASSKLPASLPQLQSAEWVAQYDSLQKNNKWVIVIKFLNETLRVQTWNLMINENKMMHYIIRT